jgi:type I restriction enzyme S subunit
MSNDLPESWRFSSVERLATIGSGQSSKVIISKCKTEGEVPWFKVSDMNLEGNEKYMRRSQSYLSNRDVESLGMKVFPAGAVIFPKRGGAISTNKKRILTQPSCIDSNTMALTPQGCSSDYFWLWFCTVDLGRLSDGSNIPQINNPDILPLEVPLAPLAEQGRIVTKLEKLLAQVDNCQHRLARIPALLKRFRQSVLAAACSGRLTADWREEHPDVEVATELLSRIRSGRPANTQPPNEVEEMPDDELPDGWTWVTLWEIIQVQNGRSFPSKEYTKGGVHLLRPGNLHISGTLEWNSDNTRLLPTHWAEDYPEFVLDDDELLMNLTAQSLKDEFLGRVCLKSDKTPALLNQRICRFKNWTKEDLRPFLFVYFKSPPFRSYVNTLDTGSLIRHMHSKQVLAHVVPLPPLLEQQEIVRRVKSLSTLADHLEKRFAEGRKRVDSITQAILAKAFRGELVPTEFELAKAEGRSFESAEELLDRIGRNGHNQGKRKKV